MSQRNGQSSYQRRIEGGLARGLTRSQARGHPKSGERSASGKEAASRYDLKLEAALKQLRRPGASLSKVAADAQVGRERLSRYVKTFAGAKREGRRWTFDDQRIRRLGVLEVGATEPAVIRVRGFDAAHLAGLHAYEAGQVVSPDEPDANRAERQKAFEKRSAGQGVRDVNGRWHELSTDPNQLLQAIHMQDYSFERYYRIEQ